MEMIIGGAFQGKSDYAKEKHPEICWKNGGKLEEYQLMKAEGVLDFQEFIRKELKAGHDVAGLAEKLAEGNPDIVVVSQEVGYGVVPMDALTGNTGKQWAESVRDLLPKAKSDPCGLRNWDGDQGCLS